MSGTWSIRSWLTRRPPARRTHQRRTVRPRLETLDERLPAGALLNTFGVSLLTPFALPLGDSLPAVAATTPAASPSASGTTAAAPTTPAGPMTTTTLLLANTPAPAAGQTQPTNAPVEEDGVNPPVFNGLLAALPSSGGQKPAVTAPTQAPAPTTGSGGASLGPAAAVSTNAPAASSGAGAAAGAANAAAAAAAAPTAVGVVPNSGPTAQITAILNSQGVNVLNGVTNTTQPTVVGTTNTAGATVNLYVDGQLTASAQANSKGQWSVALPNPLANGTHGFGVVPAGTAPPTTAPYQLTVDTVPPTVTLTAPDFEDYRPAQFTVSATDPYGMSGPVGIDVDLQHDGSFTDPGDQNVLTGTLQGNGSITLTFKQTLPKGTFLIRAHAVDVAGNVGYSATATMQSDPNLGYVGSPVLYDLAHNFPNGTPFKTPTGMVGVPLPNERATATPILPRITHDGLASGYGDLQFNSSETSVLVDVHVTLDTYLSALATSLTKLGFQQTATTASQGMVTGWLPINQIMNLEGLSHFASVVPVYGPMYRFDPIVDPEGDTQTLAASFRSTYNVDGTGVMVGAISDSVNQYNGGIAASVAVGALPSNPPVDVLSDGPAGSTDEGRAMLEIVHRLAPGARLAFATSGDTPQAMAGAIQALASTAGANVITDDVGFFNEPMFNDGVIAQAAQSVVNQGVFYTSAAGNVSNEGYLANWDPVSATVGGVAGTFQNISGGSPLQTFTLGPGITTNIAFEWDAAYLEGGTTGVGTGNFQPPNDMQVLITDSTGATLLGMFDANATNPDEAYVGIQFTNTTGSTATFAMSFQLVSGPAPTMIRWVNNDENDPDIDALGEGAPTIYGHPVAAGVVAVGATDASGNDGGSPYAPDLRYTSLGGNLPILFDSNGNRLATPDIRVKPEVAAPSDVSTSFFEPGNPNPNGNGSFLFLGTSAATPHVAAAAALLDQQAGGIQTPATLTQHLEQTALNIGYPTYAGAGLIQLEPIVIPPPPPPTPTPTPTGPPINGGGGGGQTSDTATNLGTLSDGTATITGLTISPSSPLGYYNWFEVAMGAAGTFTAGVTLTSGGPLEEHLFTVQGGTMNEVSNVTISTSGALSLPVNGGDMLLVEVKFVELSPGVASQGDYTLTLTLG